MLRSVVAVFLSHDFLAHAALAIVTVVGFLHVMLFLATELVDVWAKLRHLIGRRDDWKKLHEAERPAISELATGSNQADFEGGPAKHQPMRSRQEPSCYSFWTTKAGVRRNRRRTRIVYPL